ncbi:hypothetical protein BK126_05265 [Paenibacillus sp. FSL H7-0326]|uniref:hypothetical protein n=1 Tax=Paenibacillus sp. FSL H7-0326 TaxID=1921144 RepID=UPI00096F0CE5|nr:hypothetical protein [Paenibacillus sp. FSL H7-0326]OMC71489.1 hypothetical protein BK126_05265 [Paenibacillus sp. FSL H7-0326]
MASRRHPKKVRLLMNKMHMLDKPYIRSVIQELENLGYTGEDAKEMLVRYYRVMRWTVGFEPNAEDFAREIVEIQKAVNRKYDPTDPNQIYVGHLRGKLIK